MYDLSREAPRYQKALRAIRWFMTGAVAFAIVGAVLVLIPFVVPFANLHGSYPAAAAAAVFAILFAFVRWAASPLADGFDMDGVGLRFTYKGRIVWHIDWENPRFWIIVDTTEGASDWASDGRPTRAVAFGLRGFRAMLTPEAYDAMLAEFQRRGLVGERRPRVKTGYTRIRFYRPAAPALHG